MRAMKLRETPLPGVFVVDIEPVHDERGFFATTYSDALRAHLPHIAQSAISFTSRRGTMRGLHYQRDPFAEVKLVRCTRGAIFDVAVDLQTRRWFGTELTPDNGRMLLIPSGCAHGFQSLADDTEVSYSISAPYRPEVSGGVRWNDPAFGIKWPLDVTVISGRDESFPDVSS